MSLASLILSRKCPRAGFEPETNGDITPNARNTTIIEQGKGPTKENAMIKVYRRISRALSGWPHYRNAR